MADLMNKVKDALEKHVTANNPNHSHAPHGGGASQSAAVAPKTYSFNTPVNPTAQAKWSNHPHRIESIWGDNITRRVADDSKPTVWEGLAHLDVRPDHLEADTDLDYWVHYAQNVLGKAATELHHSLLTRPLIAAHQEFRQGNLTAGRKLYDVGLANMKQYLKGQGRKVSRAERQAVEELEAFRNW